MAWRRQIGVDMDRDLATTIENLSAQELAALMQFLSLVPSEGEGAAKETPPSGGQGKDYSPLDL